MILCDISFFSTIFLFKLVASHFLIQDLELRSVANELDAIKNHVLIAWRHAAMAYIKGSIIARKL